MIVERVFIVIGKFKEVFWLFIDFIVLLVMIRFVK